MIRLVILLPMLLVGCGETQPNTEKFVSPDVLEPEPLPQREAPHLTEHERRLIDEANQHLENAKKRLDWLRGTDPGT